MADQTTTQEKTSTLDGTAPLPLPVVLRVHGAAAMPRELRLGPLVCVVGADSEADLTIMDKAVSRRHLELELTAEGVALRDLGSHNGTFYLGQRVERMVLRPGSRVRVGNTDIAIDVDREALDKLESSATEYRGMVGASAPMRRLFAVLARLEGSLVNVLVEGESGAGKELVARAIHRGSQRRDAPLVVVNCGALGRELVRSELFGHLKGAFTGATEARAGAFELADGGTLFLDEIGEVPLDVQPVLLRALESGEIQRIGEGKPRNVDVRIVAATNRDLEKAVQEGRFREDLFFRLTVVRLRVPPLHERPDDVPLLARRFATEAGAPELPNDVLAELSRRHFKGNARELRNAVLAYLALGTLPDSRVSPASLLEEALKLAIDSKGTYQDQKDAIGDLFSRLYLTALLRDAGGNQSEAARIAAVDRSYLRKLLAKYGLL